MFSRVFVDWLWLLSGLSLWRWESVVVIELWCILLWMIVLCFVYVDIVIVGMW